MKKTVLFISLLVCTHLNAQNLTLKEALELAQSQKIKQTDIEVLNQEINLKIQKSKRLPLIYAEANMQRNLIIPVTPVPSIAFDPNAQPGSITPLQFATNWSSKAGLQLSFDIYNPTNQLNIKQAQNTYQKALLEQNENKVNQDKLITDLYAQAFLAQQQYDLSLINEENFQETLEIILNRYDSGRVSEIEKNTALQKSYELESYRFEAELILKNKYLELSKYLDVSNYNQFTTLIQDIITDFKRSDFETEKLFLDVESKKIDINNNKLAYLPKISLNGFYGSQFFDNEFRLTNSERWFGNSYVNLAIQIPISENYERNIKKKKLKLELESIQSKLEESQKNDEVLNLQNENEVRILAYKIANLEKTVNLTKENLNVLKAKVTAGTILISDYNNEMENYMEQNKKLWQSLYDLLKIRLNE